MTKSVETIESEANPVEEMAQPVKIEPTNPGTDASELEGAETSELEGTDTSEMRVHFLRSAEEIENLSAIDNLSRFEKGLSDKHALNLAAQFADVGQFTPVTLRENSDGALTLIAGNYRRKAVVMMNNNPVSFGLPEGTITPLKGVIVDCSELGAIAISYQENKSRKEINIVDEIMFAYRLRQMRLSNAEICRIMTVDDKIMKESQVSLLITMAKNVPNNILIMAHRGELPGGRRTLVALSIIKKAAQCSALVKQLIAGEITPTDIEVMAGEKRRASGKAIKRKLSELVALFEDIGTAQSMGILDWLSGSSVTTTDQVRDWLAGEKIPKVEKTKIDKKVARAKDGKAQRTRKAKVVKADAPGSKKRTAQVFGPEAVRKDKVVKRIARVVEPVTVEPITTTKAVR